MLSRFALAVFIVSVTVFPFAALAQSADTNLQQPEKVAKVNFQEAVSATHLYQKMKEDLTKKSAPRKKALAKQNAELETLRLRLSSQGSHLSDKERNNLTITIAMKEKALQADQDQLRDEFQKDATQALNKLSQRLWPVLQNYAKTNGYAVILDTGASPNRILWATDETVSKYGLKGKAPTEIENGLLSVFSDKGAQPVDHELTAALDAALR